MLDLDDIKLRLRPIKDEIVQGHLDAWANWQRFLQRDPEGAAPLTSQERASFVHQHVCSEVDIKVRPLGYAMSDSLGFACLPLGPDLLVRFKYLRDGEPHNVDTVQQRLLAQQQYSDEMMNRLALDGYEKPPTLVTAGYLLNLRETEISRVLVLRQCEGYPTVQYELYPEQAVQEPLRLPNVDEPPRPARVRSIRRPALHKEAGEESEP